MAKQTINYASSGVDIDAGDRFVEKIKPLAKATKRLGVVEEIGGFGALFDIMALKYKNPLLVASTDGVGTKLKIAEELNIHNTVGIDLVAMCVNDIVVQGAEPLFFMDYIATGKLEVDKMKEVVAGIADGCKQANCALIGGETAEMPGFYKAGEYDLAGFAVGIVERDRLLPKKNIQEGDLIIGLPSSGIHSNGYSLVRKVVKVIDKDLLTPTKIYVKTCLELARADLVKGFSHITGGGITENLPRIFNENLSAKINLNAWERPSIFNLIQNEANIDELEMLRTFNCGIGMIAIIDENNLEAFSKKMISLREEFFVIGEMISGDGRVVY